MNVHGVDLNLLPILQALLQEAHITRAALRVGLSQPAMSNALARLRRVFDDPLLVRHGGRMVLTPKAEGFKKHLAYILTDIEHHILQEQAFDPLAFDDDITLLLNDYNESIVMPSLMARLQGAAPRMGVMVKIMGNERPYPRIASGEVDLAIGYFPDCPEGFYQRRLFAESFVCLARADHPRIQVELTLDAFLREQHVMISPGGRRGGVIDRILEQRGLARRVAVLVGHFHAAPALVLAGDYITTVPARTVRPKNSGLRVWPPPLDVPGFEVSMIWGERTHRDPARKWLRAQIADLAATWEPPTLSETEKV